MRSARQAGLPALLALCCALAAGSASAQAPPEPDGYRLDAYQAPVPATVLGTPALTTAGAKTLWTERRATFIDVVPHVPKPAGLPAGTIWNEAPHRSIPGAVWLPDVGRGALSPQTERYLKQGLAAITQGNQHQPLVIFCKRDCWMSWNAAKRIRGYGYDDVSWYADGVEGWSEAELPLAEVQPRPDAGG